MLDVLVRCQVLLAIRMREAEGSERGDVPGWVLITVMTAGLVAGLWAIAGDTLSRMLTQALNSVRG
ncbi:MAG: hypothetical protein AVDCRST_MAG72-657 [uncultured Nocardioidaceae bacterium]|uniref:Uncharacterized protein n=1 Tax=uncultured Nocardioidaceae bacterium TaxID=253824 RepID=A0A6J4LUE0_9ACTN|nr:MAG: hypothetical protein AVDCRST_MAG72-657 [uncultured Nocardioidaceae bacterium]